MKRFGYRFAKIEFLALMLFSSVSQASFIESTIGTAVVNDATASYFNPAALILLKNSQIIPQLTFASFNTQFRGQSTFLASNITDTGSSQSNTHYYSPSLYFGIPANKNIILGLAVVSNSADRNADENSILRYVQASNNIEDYDIVPALAIKINDVISIGGGINFSHAHFALKAITGFPGSNIADSQSNNTSDGGGIGGNAGFLIKATATTLIGFNYRSITTYRLNGKSVFAGNPQVVSDDYHFILRTPSRAVLSASHFFTDTLGMIATIQRINWSIITNAHVKQFASPQGIVNGVVPFYLNDTWLFTLGGQYRVSSKCTLRAAGSYNQSTGNPHYQIANGDSVILGASMGYKLNQTLTIDGSYAHAFLKNEHINIHGNRFFTSGVNSGSRDAISLKLTLNV